MFAVNVARIAIDLVNEVPREWNERTVWMQDGYCMKPRFCEMCVNMACSAEALISSEISPVLPRVWTTQIFGIYPEPD